MPGCCGASVLVRPREWNPSPLHGFLVNGFPGWQGALRVEESAEPCCDACALKDVEPIEGCGTGTCGLPMTAGIPLPLGHGAGAVMPVRRAPAPLPPAVDEYARAWGKATGVRPAGVVQAVTPYNRNFRRSTLPDLTAMNDFDLYERETDLAGLDFAGDTPPAVIAEYRAELAAVRQELLRREIAEPGGLPPETPSSTTDPEPEPSAERRRQIGEQTADRLAPGDTPADRARHDAIVQRAVSGSFAAFNQWLDGEYDVQVEQIRGSTAITLARLRNEDNAGRREYDLARGAQGGTSGGSSGGGGAAVGLSLIALLALASKAF